MPLRENFIDNIYQLTWHGPFYSYNGKTIGKQARIKNRSNNLKTHSGSNPLEPSNLRNC